MLAVERLFFLLWREVARMELVLFLLDILPTAWMGENFALERTVYFGLARSC
jgi:hypothetical protein